jgi:hypothetical protein
MNFGNENGKWSSYNIPWNDMRTILDKFDLFQETINYMNERYWGHETLIIEMNVKERILSEN